MRLKKVFSIICLAALAICFAGPHPVFSLYRACLKKEMRKFLEQNSSKMNLELVEFKLPDGEKPGFEILDEGKEIRLNGVMYDVLKKTRNINEVVFICIKDKKETSLLQRFKNVLTTHTGSFPVSRQAAMVLARLFSQHYLPAQVFIVAHPFTCMWSQYFIYNRIASLYSPEISSPPPEPVA